MHSPIKFYILSLSLSVCNLTFTQEWLTDLDQAKSQAALNNQNIILVFQGSDWCAPCIKLEKNIWSSQEFISYSKDHFILLKVDFPKRKKNKLSEIQTQKNKKIAEQYNKNGYFPFIVVLDSDGNVLKEMGYEKLTPAEYINLLYIPHPEKMEYHITKKLMGSRFDITVVAEDTVEAETYIQTAVTEISRIERLISSWDIHSETFQINKNAGVKPVEVDAELFDLIERSTRISQLTDGAFDITYAAFDDIWKFDGSMTELPTPSIISNTLKITGYNKIELDKDNHTVFLPEKGMKIGFGAIGKGYAADSAKELLISEGVPAGIINASGDMNTWGKRPNGKDWTIAITNPFNKDKIFAMLPIVDGAVVTSGNYQKYTLINGQKYTHIIDPRTGFPAKGITSVTVFAPKAELADALATSVFVLGIEVGIDRVNQMPNIECIVVDDNGSIKTSNNIQIDQL